MNLLCKASDYLRRSRGLANSVTNGADMRLDLERKDVWNMKWADDNPELFAILEKTRHSNTYSARLLQDVRQVIHKITVILLKYVIRQPKIRSFWNNSSQFQDFVILKMFSILLKHFEHL